MSIHPEPAGVSVPRSFHRHAYIGAGLLLGAFCLLRLAVPGAALSSHDSGAHLEDFPRRVGAWQSHAEADLSQTAIDWIGLDDWLQRSYRRAGEIPVWLYVGHIAGEDLERGRDHHSPLACFPGQGWEVVDQGLQDIDVPDHGQIRVDRLVVQQGKERKLVLYWYHWGDRLVAEGDWGDYGAKIRWLIRLPELLTGGGRSDRTFVRVSSPVAGDVGQALERQTDFIRSAFPDLVRHFSLDLSS